MDWSRLRMDRTGYKWTEEAANGTEQAVQLASSRVDFLAGSTSPQSQHPCESILLRVRVYRQVPEGLAPLVRPPTALLVPPLPRPAVRSLSRDLTCMPARLPRLYSFLPALPSIIDRARTQTLTLASLPSFTQLFNTSHLPSSSFIHIIHIIHLHLPHHTCILDLPFSIFVSSTSTSLHTSTFRLARHGTLSTTSMVSNTISLVTSTPSPSAW